MNPRNVTLGATAALLIPAWLGIASAAPTIPGPLTTLPAFSCEHWSLLDWRRASFRFLLSVESSTPPRSGQDSKEDGLFAATVLLDVIWFVDGSTFGLQYQGAAIYTFDLLEQRCLGGRYRRFTSYLAEKRKLLLEVRRSALASFCVARVVRISLLGELP